MEDAKLEPRALANSLVVRDLGFPVSASQPPDHDIRYNLGTLCVIDVQPRVVDREQIEDLSDLALVVMDQLELRLSARTALEKAQLMVREIDHRS